jgi:hypothetical protein
VREVTAEERRRDLESMVAANEIVRTTVHAYK